MEMEMDESRWEGYMDWRGAGASRSKHGGFRAAFFVLVVESMENLAYLANASNLVTYLTHYMHLTPSEAANNVTNFMGTAFLLALLGGFFSDAFFTAYCIYVISAIVQFLGLAILTIQARFDSLRPPKCNTNGDGCQDVGGAKAALLYLGLYLVALGVGGIKGSLPSHGAEQFDETTPRGRKMRSTFFNYYVFALSCGALIAVTLVVWIEDNKGWQWGFGISMLTILLSIPVFLSGSMFYRNKIPLGSPLTTIFKVIFVALINNFAPRSSSNAIVNMATSPSPSPLTEQEHATLECDKVLTTSSLKFLDKAAVINEHTCGALKCSVQQVEEVKIVLKILPIFACTIVLNCCLAQLSTFSVQQAATMDTKLGSLKVPPASLPVFPVIFIIILAPLYDHVVIPYARRVTKTERGISHLQRIGLGLILSIIAMAMAALVEIKRKRVADASHSSLDPTTPLPITFLWVALQYLFLGSADLFTLAGLMEFFFTEVPPGMRSLATSLSFASLAMGYYLSTFIVEVVNRVSNELRHKAWLSGADLNHYQLDKFYWFMCGLSVLNFLHYIFWACRYKYRSMHNGG